MTKIKQAYDFLERGCFEEVVHLLHNDELSNSSDRLNMLLYAYYKLEKFQEVSSLVRSSSSNVLTALSYLYAGEADLKLARYDEAYQSFIRSGEKGQIIGFYRAALIRLDQENKDEAIDLLKKSASYGHIYSKKILAKYKFGNGKIGRFLYFFYRLFYLAPLSIIISILNRSSPKLDV